MLHTYYGVGLSSMIVMCIIVVERILPILCARLRMLLSTQRVLKKMNKSSVSVSSKQQISPSFWKAGGRV